MVRLTLFRQIGGIEIDQIDVREAILRRQTERGVPSRLRDGAAR